MNINKKIRVIFDVMPDSMPDSIAVQEIDLKQKAGEGNVEERAVSEVKNNPPENTVDDLLSEIIDVDPEMIVKEHLASVFDEVEPLVELARIGATIGSKEDSRFMNHELRRGEIQDTRYKIQDSRFTNHESQIMNLESKITNHESRIVNHDQEFLDKILGQIHAPVRSGRVVLASSVRPKPIAAGPRFALTPKAKPAIQHPRAIIKEEILIQESSVDYSESTRINPEKEAQIVSFYNAPEQPKLQAKSLNFHTSSGIKEKKKRAGLWFAMLIIGGLLTYGVTLKNEITKDGVMAFDNLEQAGESLKQFNFSGASENFQKSYQELAGISQTMNFMGVGLAGIFENLPGFDTLTAGSMGKIKSAKNIVDAGKLIAEAGHEMSTALNLLSQTGAILDPAPTLQSGQANKNKSKPSKIVNQIKDALALSAENFSRAKAMILEIDESAVPEDKREKFNDFKDKLPLLEEYLGHAVEYTEFLEGLVGIDKPKKYLLLFNNYSELRPTGGFPGTYGVVSFAGGGLSDFFVDDVYNLDGQLKRNIVPPKQLQHITPNWGMRDSAWFLDFPTSARKSMSFFSEEAGYKVNGVIAINPDIVNGILDAVGPIEMPEYGLTLTSANFIESIQEEVEYGDNREQPKKVVVDFAPKFLKKLYSSDAATWAKIFNVFMSGLEEKDIIFYFEDKALENFAIKENFGGEIKKIEGDYLSVNFSNVKGSKTDIVTDSVLNIDTRLENGKAVHKVKITRNHKGGDHEHGFYNRQNPAYVRVLVPEEAELLSINGQDIPNYKPLVSYTSLPGFEHDSDLKKYESGFFADTFPGVEKFYEGDKKGIAFWMVTDPRKSKTVEFEYSVPFSGDNYNFYLQKQPGLKAGLEASFESDEPISATNPQLNKIGDKFYLNGKIDKDVDLNIMFK